MMIFMDVPLIVATATSNFMIGVTAAAQCDRLLPPRRHSSGSRGSAGSRRFLGSLLGARLSPRIHKKVVVYLLVGVMFYLAGHLLLHLAKVHL